MTAVALIGCAIWALAMLADGLARQLDDDQHAHHS